MEAKWRFPLLGGGRLKGISDGNEETFKGFPYKSFARETLQNSIDVRVDDNAPVRVEISKFYIPRENIPGIEDYKRALQRCINLWINNKDEYVKVYQAMIDYLDNTALIPCLRISDFNTTGLIGVDTQNLNNNNYLALVKGTGFSSKGIGVKGGSKGVGKNAAFLLSKLNLVFYSTKTEKACGSIGVGRLISGFAYDNIEINGIEKTQGDGYYSIGNAADPIKEIISLDPIYNKRQNYNGTDIFIVGFKEESNWENEVLTSILDSFLHAIFKERLEIEFNGIEINAQTIGSIIKNKITDRDVIAQYDIFSDIENVQVYEIETEIDSCELYLKVYNRTEYEKAANKCFMVRYPGMGIMNINFPDYNISAICVIPNNDLGKALLEIENPTHTKWEPNRIEDPNVRSVIKKTISDIQRKIRKIIGEALSSGEFSEIDPYGAGDFLPDIDSGDSASEGEKEKTIDEEQNVTKLKINETFEKNPREESKDGSGLEPTIGSVTSDGDDAQVPDGKNDGEGGSHPGKEPRGIKEGDSILFQKKEISGIRYKVVSLGRTTGKLRVNFVGPEDLADCYIKIYSLDDNNNKSQVHIESLTFKDDEISSSDGYLFGPFDIKRNEKIKLDIKTNYKSYFASEVRIYANKK